MQRSDTVVILNQSSGYLQVDILEALGEKYKNRAIIAGEIRTRDKELPNDVKWHKVIKYNRNSFVRRAFTWFVCTIQMFFIILWKYRKADLLIVSNPPTATLLPLIIGNSFSLLIYDIYPDSLLQILSNKNSFIIRVWKYLNKVVFKKAMKVYTLTDGMKTALANYVDASKIQVVPIWTNNTFLKPIPKDENSFIKQQQLQNKFIVMYSGNIGYTHPVEVIVEVAREIQNSNIEFIVVGEGEKKALLMEKATAYKLDNIRFLPFQTAKDLRFSLSAADIAFVTLSTESSALSVPSKTYSLFSVGAALLCIASPTSELARVIKRYNNGSSYEQGEIEEMKHFIEDLASNKEKLKVFKENSLKASLDYGPENAKQFL